MLQRLETVQKGLISLFLKWDEYNQNLFINLILIRGINNSQNSCRFIISSVHVMSNK